MSVLPRDRSDADWDVQDHHVVTCETLFHCCGQFRCNIEHLDNTKSRICAICRVIRNFESLDFAVFPSHQTRRQSFSYGDLTLAITHDDNGDI